MIHTMTHQGTLPLELPIIYKFHLQRRRIPKAYVVIKPDEVCIIPTAMGIMTGKATGALCAPGDVAPDMQGMIFE